MHDQLVKKVNAVFTSKLVNNTYYNAMIKDIENKKASIFNLALLLLAMLLKISCETLLILSKNRWWCEKKETEIKYFTTFDYNKFTNGLLDEKIKKQNIS